MGDLTARLTAEFPAFGFFQALSLAEEHFRAKKGVDDPFTAGLVRFHSDPSTVFPPNDITGAAAAGDRITLMLSFMGLTGVSSPLPHYFSEYVQRNGTVSPALEHFLSIFEQRTYTLFYRAWKKYHFIRTLAAAGTDPFTRLVASLAGVDLNGPATAETLRMLSCAGALAARTRGASGLQAVITSMFDGIPVTVRQWVPRWVRLAAPPRIGVDARLGVNAVAGTRVRDTAGKFRVVIGPLPREGYESFLAGTRNNALLRKIIGAYLNDPLDFDIEVQLQSAELVPVVLGGREARLGMTSSLGRSGRNGGIHATVTG